jgi:hypothetical protein
LILHMIRPPRQLAATCATMMVFSIVAGCREPHTASPHAPSPAPPEVWRDEATDGAHICGLRGATSAGTVWCRDATSFAGEPARSPIELGIRDAVHLAMSEQALCVLRGRPGNPGHVACGSLGVGLDPVRPDVAFRDLGGSPDPIGLAMFADAVCVLDRAQTVWCRDLNSPAGFRVVPRLAGARALVLGTLVPAEYESPIIVFGCAVTAQRRVACFLAPSSTADEVPGFTGVTELVIPQKESGRVCARTQRGPLRCVTLDEHGAPDGAPAPPIPGEAEAWGNVATAAPR